MDQRLGRRYKNARKLGTGAAALRDYYNIFVHAKIAEGVSERTLETYEENYRFLCDYLDLKKIPHYAAEVTPDVLRSYINWMLTEKRKWEGHAHKAEEDKTVGLSPVTVNTRLKGLRTMFGFLFEEGHVDTNPFDRVKPVREPEETIEIMSEQQMQLLLKMPNKKTYVGFRDFVFMNLLIDGFFRINEALKLSEREINFELGLVTIPGRRVKTRVSKTVPLSKGTQKLLSTLIAENSEFNTDFLFLTNYGEPISDDRMRDRIKYYAEKAGMSIRIYPHLFRHSAATLYIENGGDPRSLAELLGHTDMRMVMKYTHLSKSAIADKHDKYSPIHNVTGKLSKNRKTKR